MLALLQWHVEHRSGTFAFCDTDSMAIVAAEREGTLEIDGRGNDERVIPQKVKVLSWREVAAIARAFEPLNPYDRTAVPESILKIEDVNFRDGVQVQLHAFVAGTKRYAIFEHRPGGESRVTDQYSEHGLGHVLSPVEVRESEDDWRRRVWDYIIRRELGLPAELPPWADYPAVGRHAITTWHLMKTFERFNRGKSYGSQVKPFNFMLTVQHDPFAASRFEDGLRLIAPFEPNPDKWSRMTVFNLHGGEELRLSNSPYAAPDTVGYQSYRDLIVTHAYRKETKRTGPDGLPCEERARGVLGRRTVRSLRMDRIGKEADRHEERDLAAHLDDLITNYGNLPDGIEERIIRPALRTFLREAAHATGIDLENLRKIAHGKRRARGTGRRIVAALAALCGAELRALGIQAPRRRLAVIKLYLDVCKLAEAPGQANGEDSNSWELVRFALDNLTPQEIALRSGISIPTLKAIRYHATPMPTPPVSLVAASVEVCRLKLRRAGLQVPRSHQEVLELYRHARQQDLARVSGMEAELSLLESKQRADLHARFLYWHDLTGCWKRKTVHTRYHSATADNPRGTRSSWAKIRPVESILGRAIAELGEDFNTFTHRVCRAIHERPRRIAELQRRVINIREHLADGRLLLKREV
jgi:hypothetical protein